MKTSSLLSGILITVAIMVACKPGSDQVKKIVLTNTSGVNLTEKAITIQRNDLKKIPDGVLYPVLMKSDGKVMPSQLDDLDHDGEWDHLFFLADIPAGGHLELSLSWSEKKPEFANRTNVRFGKRSSEDSPVVPITTDTLMADQVHAALGYEPYQTDGPMWENDKVGFRHYFDGRNANDLFGKKVSYMSPDSLGINSRGAVTDNYHVMSAWGRDILSVGNSAGLGGFGLMIGDSIIRLGITAGDTMNNIRKSVCTIISTGPVHAVLHFEYSDWHVLGRLYDVDEVTDIWPGMYAYRNTVRISGLQGDEKMLVGLVNSNTDVHLSADTITGKYVILSTHDLQTYDKTWYLGMALILPEESYLGYGETPDKGSFSNTYYGKLNIVENTPVSYYAVGCWELSNEKFREPVYFHNYITNLAEQLAAGVTISFE